MFIVEFSEKLRRSATRRNMDERAAAHRQELTERGKKAIGKWRKIANPTPAVQDQIWEFLYEKGKKELSGGNVFYWEL